MPGSAALARLSKCIVTIHCSWQPSAVNISKRDNLFLGPMLVLIGLAGQFTRSQAADRNCLPPAPAEQNAGSWHAYAW